MNVIAYIACTPSSRRLLTTLTVVMMLSACSLSLFAQTPGQRPARPSRPAHRVTSPVAVMPDSIPLGEEGVETPAFVVTDSLSALGDSVTVVPMDSLAIINAPGIDVAQNGEVKFTFTPDPTRAVWMSALFPGLGQLYNRRYWKLPIVIGAFMGLGYATSWNSTMLRDYTTAYSDIMDNDPTTESYKDFFAPGVDISHFDQSYLTNLLRTRKNYYRRNRDLCILCMIGVYAVAMIDAYVDAQLAHFDISPSLSVDVAPAIIPSDSRSARALPSLGLQWAFNF